MKSKFRKVPPSVENSCLLIRDIVGSYFHNPYHYHPEYELTAIIKGVGMRYIGDSIKSFKGEELVLVGSNLAHMWKCDDIYYKENSSMSARAIVIQFNKNFLGQDFWKVEEMSLIEELLLNSQRGIKISEKAKRIDIKNRMVDMLTYDPIDQVACLLSILNLIVKTDEYKLLASTGFTSVNKSSEQNRINKVCSFVINNFQHDICLQNVADIIHMTPQGFCRFFKKETHKTFSTYLNEIRIGYACKLLMDNSFQISQVALESGFNTISYFNKKFKKIMGKTPSQYKSHFKLEK